MIEITPELKKMLLRLADISIIKNKSVNDIMKILMDNTVTIPIEELLIRENHECNLKYDQHSPEIFLWKLGLICENWTLELFKQKTKEGHCETHVLPCQSSKEFHKDLFYEAKKNFEELTKSHNLDLE